MFRADNSGVIVNVQDILHFFLVFLLLTSNKLMLSGLTLMKNLHERKSPPSRHLLAQSQQ